MKIAITYDQLYDRDGNYIKIGGVETYLLHLSELLLSMNYSVKLFQGSSVEFNKYIGNLEVKGVPVTGFKRSKIVNELYKNASNWINKKEDIIIFGADHFSVPTKNKKCISIQHGISWDLPSKYFTKKSGILPYFVSNYRKYIFSKYMAKKYFNNCYNRVCVDYNYLNWYRTACIREPKGNIWVIPNFIDKYFEQEDVMKKHDNSTKEVKILFARRFEKIRGTELMVDAVKYICSKYDQVSFTFAGEGEDAEWLKIELKKFKVSFIKYLPSESIKVHMNYDIAVIPSIASEGTSFSVLEAMGAGCAVIATAIGGITNIIIDDYNGMLIFPNSNSLKNGLEKLILNRNLREKLSKNAYITAINAFSLEKWQNRWKEVILKVEDI